MKVKATARQGFYDVYQEGDGEPLRRLYLTACIYRLAEAVRQRLGFTCENHSALKPRNRPSRGISSSLVVQPSANCRNLGVASATAESSFQLLTSGALIAIQETQVVMATRNQMLRITRKANGAVVFKVSGQLNAENVAEIGALIAAERTGRRIVLDCRDLRSVDGEAVKFLEKWQADSIKLKNCGLYIREWIRRERLERESEKSLDE